MDHLLFSRSDLLSVYADMSTCCKVWLFICLSDLLWCFQTGLHGRSYVSPEFFVGDTQGCHGLHISLSWVVQTCLHAPSMPVSRTASVNTYL